MTTLSKPKAVVPEPPPVRSASARGSAPSATAHRLPAARPASVAAASKSGKGSAPAAKAPAKTASQAPTRAGHHARPTPPPRLDVVVKAFESALKNFNRGDFAGACGAFEKLVDQYQGQTDIAARAKMYIQICRQRIRPVSTTPKTADSFYDRGVLEMNRGNHSAAIGHFESALKSQPDNAYAMYALAAAQVRAGQHEAGLRNLERAIEAREIFRSHARQDADFGQLKSNARFQELVGTGYESEAY